MTAAVSHWKQPAWSVAGIAISLSQERTHISKRTIIIVRLIITGNNGRKIKNESDYEQAGSAY
jgi:hypothetical protein